MYVICHTVLDEIIHDLNLGDNEKLRKSIKMEGSLNTRSNYFRSVQLKVTVYFGKAKSKRKREKMESPIDNKKGCTKGKNAN